MLRLKFIPYEMVRNDFNKIMRALQNDALVLIDAKLDPEEEADLIKDTMERLSGKFKGIELSSLGFSDKGRFDKVRNMVAELLTGKKRGFTLIGPAHVVRKIKRNPSELMVYM